MNDITIIFLTVNRVPLNWVEYHRGVLLEAIGETPIITVSAIPTPLGKNLIQTPPWNVSNIYRQMLRAAQEAKTPFVAVAEDDTLYPEEHFKYRPSLDSFAYNMSRWGILSWREKPSYFYRHRESNSALIAPRELLIKCLNERFDKYPGDIGEYGAGEVGKERVEKNLKLPHYNVVRFHSREPLINFHHIFAIDKLEQRMRKRENKSLIAYDIPKWGRAEDIIKKFI